MQVQQDSNISRCTVVDNASGKETPCGSVGEIEGSVPGSLLCRDHALLDVTGSAKLKLIKTREQSMQMGGAHGAYGAMYPPKPAHAMVPPSLFGFPIVIDHAPQGVIHSFFVVPVIPQAPPGYKDDYNFLTATDSFPVCAAVLGDVEFKMADLDRLLNRALKSDVSITLTDVSSEEPPPYPFSVPLPVAAFLHPPIGHDSGAVLLETLGAAMCRQKGGIEGFVSNFNTTLAAAEPEAADENQDASSQAKSKRANRRSSGSSNNAVASEDMVASTWIPSLEERLDAFFSLLTVHLHDLWNEPPDRCR
jgi:hypothetical protein